MKKIKTFFIQQPESYLLSICLLAGFTPPFHFNPLAIGFAILLSLQLYFKNKISGLFIGSLFALLNLFFLGAIIFEASEFDSFSSGLLQLLVGGFLIWGVNMLFSALVLRKYARIKSS